MNKGFSNPLLESDSDQDEQQINESAFNKPYYIQTTGPKKFFDKSKSFQGKKKEVDHAKSIRYQELKQKLEKYIEEIPLYLSKYIRENALKSDQICESSLETALVPLLESDRDLKYIWDNERNHLIEEFKKTLKQSLSIEKKPQLKSVEKLLKEEIESLKIDFISLQTQNQTQSQNLNSYSQKVTSLKKALHSPQSFISYCSYLHNCLLDQFEASKAKNEIPKSISEWKRFFCTYLTFQTNFESKPDLLKEIMKYLPFFFITYLKHIIKELNTQSKIEDYNNELQITFSIIFNEQYRYKVIELLPQHFTKEEEKLIEKLLNSIQTQKDSQLNLEFKSILSS